MEQPGFHRAQHISSATPKCHVLSTERDQKDFFVASVAGYDWESLKNAEIQEVPAAQQSYAMQFFLQSMLEGIAWNVNAEKEL